jgi:hypothetical protein
VKHGEKGERSTRSLRMTVLPTFEDAVLFNQLKYAFSFLNQAQTEVLIKTLVLALSMLEWPTECDAE